jgi:glutaredoxin-like YruB-family protein
MAHTVKMFTTPTCGYCRQAKDFFNDNNVSFSEVDVTKDQVALRDMADRSGQMGVPVIDVDGEIVIGFDRERLAQLLEIKL